MSSKEMEIEHLKELIKDKEASIRRKEKKLELQKRQDSGSPLRAAEERLKKAQEEKERARIEAEHEAKKTMTTSGVPLIQKRDLLMAEIEEAESQHKQQEERLSHLDAELREESLKHMRLKKTKEDFMDEMLSIVASLQRSLIDKLSRAEKHEEGEPAPFKALQTVQELTKEREADLSNNERQLREICQIIAMKKEREQELQAESEEKIRKAIVQKDEEILQVVQQCQREREEIMDRVERLRQENEAQAQSLHWKSQKTLRDIKDRKIDRKSTRGIREQITVQTSGALSGKARRAERGPPSSVADSVPKIKAKKKAAPVSEENIAGQKESKEDEKMKVRRLEGDIAKVQSDFQKTKRQLEYKISYERGQAEQFEAENRKLEQQAEHLAQTLQRLKAEVKRRSAANSESAGAIGWTGTPTSTPKPSRN